MKNARDCFDEIMKWNQILTCSEMKVLCIEDAKTIKANKRSGLSCSFAKKLCTVAYGPIAKGLSEQISNRRNEISMPCEAPDDEDIPISILLGNGCLASHFAPCSSKCLM